MYKYACVKSMIEKRIINNAIIEEALGFGRKLRSSHLFEVEGERVK